jgi:hypothetical protein
MVISILLHHVASSVPPACFSPSPLGCFTDPYSDPTGKSHRVLTHTAAAGDADLSVSKCIDLCCSAGFRPGAIAGVEAGNACYCDTGFGPYTIPVSKDCTTPCSGDPTATCGGRDALAAFEITHCKLIAARPRPGWVHDVEEEMAATKRCGKAGCTACPAEDLCCKGKFPDAYKVAGGYGCSPPTNLTEGCSQGGKGPAAGLPVGRCCCGLGPAASTISVTTPNILIIGDSVSDGYTPYVRTAFNGSDPSLRAATIGHGPDNSGGGCADGASYGALCTKSFVRTTPDYELPPWDVITFNYGLHDGADSNATYLAEITSIADQLVEVAKSAKPAGAAHSTALVYFATTHSDGGVVPGEPVSASNKRVLELNAIAAEVMAARSIPIVDLFQTMNECGAPCDAVSASSPVLSPS